MGYHLEFRGHDIQRATPFYFEAFGYLYEHFGHRYHSVKSHVTHTISLGTYTSSDGYLLFKLDPHGTANERGVGALHGAELFVNALAGDYYYAKKGASSLRFLSCAQAAGNV